MFMCSGATAVTVSVLEVGGPHAEEDLVEIHRLLRQLDPSIPEVTHAYLAEVVEHCRVAVARDTNMARERGGAIVGIVCLAPIVAITSRVGLLTHIVVDERKRQLGIGSALVELLIDEARQLGLKRIDLTSSAFRLAAQRFWCKVGFALRETNNFRLVLHDGHATA